ncbi:hypothetical protein L600_003900000010, partial [Isoptericola variabilis J7]
MPPVPPHLVVWWWGWCPLLGNRTVDACIEGV